MLHFFLLVQDEDIYTFFEPELPSEPASAVRTRVIEPIKTSATKVSTSKSGSKASRCKKQQASLTAEKRTCNYGSGWRPTMREKTSVQEGSSVLDLKGDNYFSCAVGRKRSKARYLVASLDDVVTLLKDLAEYSRPWWACLVTFSLAQGMI